MSSPSSNYIAYDSFHNNDAAKPPPPPPKPSTQEPSYTKITLETQSIPHVSPQEQSLDYVEINQKTDPNNKDSQFKLVGLSKLDQDLGEHWLPKILEDKSKQQLAEILESPKLLNALAHSSLTVHPTISACQSFLQAALDENIFLASHLKEVETHLLQLRSSCQTQLFSTHALERKWRQKQSELDEALALFAPPSLYQNLTQAIREQEQICSVLEANFLEDDGIATEREVTEWIKNFRNSRKLYHSRQAKKDRWNEGRIGGWR